jgi:hypothetical protein
MTAAQPRLPRFERFEPDMARLVKLPAWGRAAVYSAANLSLAERSMFEAEVRARIAREQGGTT